MNNKWYASIIALSLLAIAVTLFVSLTDNTRAEEHKAVYNDYVKEKEHYTNLATDVVESINKDLPGIVVYGDSLTTGAGGNGITYPNQLEKLLNQNIYDIPVVNLGVGGENVRTILGRAGSIPYSVSSFTIPEDGTPVEIKLSSEGKVVGPLKQGDGELNPVNIDGVEGKITVENPQDDENTKYFFERSDRGEEVQIKEGEKVVPGTSNKYHNYLPIIFVGQNGGYQTNQELADLISTIIDMDKANEKYIVIGLTTGDAESNSEMESVMEDNFGENYINMREYVSENGLEIAGLKATGEDKDAMEIGAVPPSLLYDETHFNKDGYPVLSQAIYERMEDLGYLDNVKEQASKLDEIPSGLGININQIK